MSDWLVSICLIFMWLHGFVTAWALAHDDEPLWIGYLDVATLRILWGRKDR